MGRPRKRLRDQDQSNRGNIISTERDTQFAASNSWENGFWDIPNLSDPALSAPEDYDSLRAVDSRTQPDPALNAPEVLHPENADAGTGSRAGPSQIRCSCMQDLYSILSSFQSPPPPSFPSSLAPLLKAATVAREVVRCSWCPLEHNTAVQNLMLLGTLLPLVAHEYGRLLDHIEEKAKEGRTLTYRVGDRSPENLSLHTGTEDCPMGFNIEFGGEEWATMARKVIRQEVHGISENSKSLSQVVDELEQRQQFWHSLRGAFSTDEQPSCRQENHQDGQICMQLIKNVRHAIDRLGL
ncbi:MAG: hypothetical protein LQ351_005744 [Letrouitia transgressa]|nr:MAG: hypothetical protein LQ351_005744 [Letrouitia transgressa]